VWWRAEMAIDTDQLVGLFMPAEANAVLGEVSEVFLRLLRCTRTETLVVLDVPLSVPA
jgi:hypothetical protein